MALHRTRDLFLRLTAACYLSAFASLYSQWDGLFGHDGLEPASRTLSAAGGGDGAAWYARERPTLLHLHARLGLTVDLMAELLMCLGMAVAILATAFPRSLFGTSPAFLVLQLCYLSVYVVGGTFLSFQWDILLLEVGACATLWAPWLPLSSFPNTRGYAFSKPSRAAAWMVRLCVFKLMFMSGAVKINADGPTWKALSALDFHYATQPLPTPLAWYAHQLPPLVQQLSVAICLVIEIPGAFLLIAPVLSLRVVGAALQVVLMVAIALTGNYTFFNFITIVLCVACVDDDVLEWCFDGWLGRCGRGRSGDDDDSGKTGRRSKKNARKRSPREKDTSAPDADSAGNPSLPTPVSPICRGLEIRGVVPALEHACACADADFKRHGFSAAGMNRGILMLCGVLPLLLSAACMFDVAPLRGASNELPSNDPSITLWDGLPKGRRIKLRDWLTRRLDPSHHWNFCLYTTCLVVVALQFVLVTLMALREAVRASATCLRKAFCGFPRKGCRTKVEGGGRSRPDCWCTLARTLLSSSIRCCHAWCMLGGVLALLVATGTTYTALSDPVRTWIPRWLGIRYTKWLRPWQLASGYGLFRTMTGVDDSHYGLGPTHPISVTARPEISIHGLDPEDNRWYEIPFLWKPNVQGQAGVGLKSAAKRSRPKPGSFDAKKSLPGVDVAAKGLAWVAPHQPRLDWQMWFAALGSYQNNPWLVVLADKLLEGSPAAFSLLADSDVGIDHGSRTHGASGTRFRPSRPPAMVRMVKTHLDFTRLNTSWSRRVPRVEVVVNDSVGKGKNNYWYRRSRGKDGAVTDTYFPALGKHDGSLTRFLTETLNTARVDEDDRVARLMLDEDTGWRCDHNEHTLGPREIFRLGKSGKYRFTLLNSDICRGLTFIKRLLLPGRLPRDPLDRGWFRRIVGGSMHGRVYDDTGNKLRKLSREEVLDAAGREGGGSQLVFMVLVAAAVMSATRAALGL